MMNYYGYAEDWEAGVGVPLSLTKTFSQANATKLEIKLPDNRTYENRRMMGFSSDRCNMGS